MVDKEMTSPSDKAMSDRLSKNYGHARIGVVGVGGGGTNAIARLMSQGPHDLEFICVNTDTQSLQYVQGAKRIQIGSDLTGGFGAGGDPETGESAAEESKDELAKALKGMDLVFVTVGMGGGTGTGAAPVVARVAKEQGALAIGLVTTPFAFEGERRMEISLAGAERLRSECDNLIIIHNDRLLRLVKKEMPIDEAFARADEAVTQGIAAVSQLVNEPAAINVDFADVRSVLSIKGRSLMAVGIGEGAEGPMEAAQQAVDNPLLDMSTNKAKGVLFQIVGGSDMTLGQVNSVGKLIAKNVDKRAIIFFGMTTKRYMEGKCQVTILATGIPDLDEDENTQAPQSAQMNRLMAMPAVSRD
ncbi:MAG: cell division protein FtsZ [Chloroflexota bacterium]|nr:cell division protein FtsZ [Chloroflexota bacterium]